MGKSKKEMGTKSKEERPREENSGGGRIAKERRLQKGRVKAGWAMKAEKDCHKNIQASKREKTSENR